MKKKIRKSVVARIFAIIMGYIAGMSVIVIGNHVDLSYQSVREYVVFVSLLMFALFYGLTFKSIVIPCKTEERIEDNYRKLTEYLHGEESEVKFDFWIWCNAKDTETKILRTIVHGMHLKCFAKIGDKKNTIDLIIRDENGTKIGTLNISDLGYFFDHFELKGQSEESN